MSYHIYTTDGIILKRTTFGEANVLLYILTSDFGLIIASAQAARLSSSKLRPALQEFTSNSVSCVKGKNGWKVTNVTEKENFFYSCPKYCHKILFQTASLLLKMIPGESPHKEIFQIVKSGFEFLKTVDREDVQDFEILLVLRVLYNLGYVEDKSETIGFLKDNEKWDGAILMDVLKKKKQLVSVINKALKESHL
jgi:DNA repair protein RecO